MRIRIAHAWLACFAVAGLVVGAVPTASSAEGERGQEVALTLDLLSLDEIRDSGGNEVQVRSDEREDAIRTISGTISTGEAFVVTVYYAAARQAPGPKELREYVALASDATRSATKLKDSLEPKGLPLVPFVAIGVTATTIAATWNPGVRGELYSLSAGEKLFDVEDSPAGLELTGLMPAFEYSISLGTIGIRIDPKVGLPASISTGLSVTTLPKDSADGLAVGSDNLRLAPLQTTELNYRTFLPYWTINDSEDLVDATAENACLFLTYGLDQDLYSFGGDGRSFQPPQDYKDYRTVMSATYDWTASEFESLSRDVGTTSVIRLADMVEVDSRLANMDNMTFDVIAEQPSYGEIDFYHVANDPYCPAIGVPLPIIGSISYLASFNVYDDGQVLVSAALARMPAHEAWTSTNSSGRWKNLFTSDATNLGCLVTPIAPGCFALMSGSADATECTANAQSVSNILTDPWYLSDVAARETVMYELALPSISAFNIGNARDLISFSGYYNWNEIRNIDGLEQAVNLEFFSLSDYTTVCSIAAIEGLTDINHMYLGVGEVVDLSPLSNLENVKYLRLSNWNGSLSYLTDMSDLDYLSIAWGTVPSIAPLSQLTSLTSLNLLGVSVADYSPLYDLPSLEYVDIRFSGATPAQISALQAELAGAYINH